MDAAVVYESMYGNSERVAQAIAEGLCETVRVEVVDVTEPAAAPDALRHVQLVVAGGPTHALGMTRPATRAEAVQRATGPVSDRTTGLREWVESLPPQDEERLAATFDTRATKVRSLPGSAARGAARAMRRAGFRLVVPSASFYVGDVEGPLDDGELDRARAWGRALGKVLVPAESPAEGR
ncbi:flavodoxin domain-containing protein [Cellulosimicrobium cellulans]|uniref:flavodoxin domain-containing protein n=1 Tax=Cellulosimicrobium TaxID=157920 RepID=UPI0008844410|nr:flavodoxin domain-containing protein [Sphaerisporangium cinnabarinum]MCR1981405.1 flavodoxin domain-containing protein [Cellulosimicrobium cellulans]PTU56671.1 flavodoxin [Sphaerisporangium cinnabarinum]SDG18659.1 Flavodoxin domain-containing protein [Cellulosimicrobium cellulans]